MSVIALIPARGGSKAIPRKNLIPIGGRPLLAYAIEAAREADCFARIIVSTDDDEIAAVGKKLGAEVPFLRPANLAEDASPMLGVLCHALDWCGREGDGVDAIALLQPTSPLRTALHIREAVSLFMQGRATSVVSVVEVPHQFNPVSVLTIQDGVLRPYLKDAPLITLRQEKPRVYARNGPAILVCAPATLRKGELYGSACIPYPMSPVDSLDIDRGEDLELAAWYLQKQRHDR